MKHRFEFVVSLLSIISILFVFADIFQTFERNKSLFRVDSRFAITEIVTWKRSMIVRYVREGCKRRVFGMELIRFAFGRE